MFNRFLAATLVGTASPVLAQSMPMNMPGMTMQAHPKTKVTEPQAKKPSAKPAAKSKHGGAASSSSSAHHSTMSGTQRGMPAGLPMEDGSTQAPVPPQSGIMAMPPMDHLQKGHSAAGMPMPGEGPTSPADRAAMGGMQMGQSAHGSMPMNGALGSYPMERESSGTAWQPDNSEPMGLMSTSGSWTLMAHGLVNLVYDHQSGPRGDDKAFASGMLMGMALRPLGSGTFQLRAMISPDPLMGPSGYPLLLASGETANGRDRLIDRQHPHDFFMELSASASQKIGRNSNLFLYAGLPGEPAFGPPAFMHREAILDSPEAPISHHWLDSTHITFGVVTVGLVLGRVKIEIGRFNGREPDEHRWNIETGPLDSTAVRISWNPDSALSLQGSWGHFTDPEQLEPGVDQKRLSASMLYAREIAPGWKLAGTLAWGRKSVEHHNDDAYVGEASIKHGAWTVFGRAELTENRELVPGSGHGAAYQVGKVSIGAVRDFEIVEHLSIGTGGLFALNFVPQPLETAYGGSNPIGLMGFVRLKLN